MKRIFLLIGMIAALPALFLGCGTFCGDTPTGVIGGEGGYGDINPANNMTGHENHSESIFGAWRHDYSPGEFDILYIDENGNFTVYEYYDYSLDDVIYGTYYYTSTEITINIQGHDPMVCDYDYTGSTLTIYYNDGPIEYYRVTLP